MNYFRKFIVLTLVFSFFVGCESAQVKVNKTISRGVYGTQEAIRAGRFDEAKRINDELIRIVAPPKDRMVINSFVTDSKKSKLDLAEPNKKYIVLPEGFDTSNVLARESAEYKNILAENENLRGKETENQKSLDKFSKQTDEAIQARDAELAKEKKKSWFWRIAGIFGFGGIIGLVALAIFFPAILPIIMSFLSGILAFLGGLITGMIQSIKNATTKFKRKEEPPKKEVVNETKKKTRKRK